MQGPRRITVRAMAGAQRLRLYLWHLPCIGQFAQPPEQPQLCLPAFLSLTSLNTIRATAATSTIAMTMVTRFAYNQDNMF